MAEKTEKATPKKLRDARKKGQVAKSQDFSSAFTFITSMGATIMAAGFLYNQIATFTLTMFRSIGNTGDFESRAPGYLFHTIQTILITSLPIVVIVAIVGVVANFFVVGPTFSFEAMKFDLKKLNPIEGIKQKFKLKTLVELIKSILKITGAAIIIYFIIWNALPQIISTVAMPPAASSKVVRDFLINATIQVGIFFVLIALFDLFFQRQQFAKEMKMEKFEVRQEYKDTEGDPMIKGKRREMFREIAYQEGPRAARRARAIITNPTHIAVALKYDPAEEPAPIILTMGVGYLADQIIKIGLENKIPIMRNVELARNLYTNGAISQYIPEDTYDAVAEILKWIQSLEENPDINSELIT
ncbi:MAG: sctU [Parachlamydiales bacterium]|nr:sctU [Parachlamydiales bacterium]